GQPAVRIIPQFGHGAVVTRWTEFENARTDKAEMQICGGCPRTAVEGEGQWSLRRRRVLPDIGGVEDLRGVAAILPEKIKCSGGRRIGQLSARRLQDMVCYGIGWKEAEDPRGGRLRLRFADVLRLLCVHARCAE